jgi:3-dehydroquinate dehydratase-1
MTSLHVLPIQPESFVALVKTIKEHLDDADIFEIWLDKMKVKGDLAVVRKYFNKPMIGRSANLDMLKRGVKAGLHYVDVPHNLHVDMEFRTLVKNKGVKVIRSYHNYETTPDYKFLMGVLEDMADSDVDYLKIATQVHGPADVEKLLSLLKETHYHGRLIVTGMGDQAREVRVKAPLAGSVFYYAPVYAHLATAPGQLTKAELEKHWDLG